MNNSNNSWSRCAKEFPISTINNNEIQLTEESNESIMRPVHVKRLEFGELSSCKGIVATDIALANLEEIERYELVTNWIADGMFTPPTSDQTTSCPSSPILTKFVQEVIEKLDEKELPRVDENLDKSPILTCKRKFLSKSLRHDKEISPQGLNKSPIIGKRRRDFIDQKNRFGLWDKQFLNESCSSSRSEKSPILGKRLNSVKKQRPGIKRKRFMDRLDFGNDSISHSYSKDNGISSVLGSIDTEIVIKEEEKQNVESLELSPEIFSEETITKSPRVGSMRSFRNRYRGILAHKNNESEDLFSSYEKDDEPLKTDDTKKESDPELCRGNNEYCLSPIIGSQIKTKRKLFRSNKTEGKSFDSIIQDTEEFIWSNIQERHWPNNSRSKRDDKLLILDSELSTEKRKFVTDTERIDCDTSSENEGDKLDPKEGRINIITGVESDSDKTVSDIIEEPMTQDYLEPLKKAPIIHSQSGLVSLCSKNSVSVNSPKISETISPKDLISPHMSITNISIETTPPQTPESFAPPADLLDSGKKKKSRPKKGSLGARLQKLISGQVSCVRIWRHQMSRESVLERSSAPCTTLLVVEGWMEYGKNLYRSKILNDPYNLLEGCLDESVQAKERDENSSRNLVVMTNPDFVGSVKLLPGTVFKIYLPWEVFNRNSSPENLVLHALYFNVVSNPVKMKLKSNDIEFKTEKHSKFIDNKVVREFDCPCLKNGKIDDTCLTKFTNHKIDIIAEIIK